MLKTAPTKAAPVESNEYPKMLYRYPAQGGELSQKLQDGHYDTAIASNAEDEAAGVADGWHTTAAEARGKSTEGTATRAELEQKATELGIEFNPRLGDKKLAALIDAKLAETA